MATYLVPADTARIAAQAVKHCDHAGLLLTRFASKEVIERQSTANDKYTLERDVWLKKFARQFSTVERSDTLRPLIQAVGDRWQAMTAGALHFRMVTRGRLIVGLGAKGALEIGITLHHTTGLPYIPGSALKGLARSFALLTIAAELGQPPVYTDPASADAASEQLAALDEALAAGEVDHPLAPAYRAIFGTQGEAGACVFFDAVVWDVPQTPHQGALFTVDVMTPHFPKYYRSSGAQPPTDADSPNPVTFLAVNEGITFAFAVGRRRPLDDETLKQARKWLRSGLMQLGVGSKTAAGYGIFAPPPKEPQG